MGSRDYMAMSKSHPANGPKATNEFQTEIGRQAKLATDDIESSFMLSANEPSLALYRIQEHVRRSVPHLVERKNIARNLGEQCKGAIFDMEYAVDAVTSAGQSYSTFKTINEQLKHSVHLAQQIQYTRKQKPSMYQSKNP